MSRHNRQITGLESYAGRRRLARRSQALMEALEFRRLLSTYQFPNQSTPQANATELQGIINQTIPVSGSSTYLGSGDTLQISPSDQFLFTIGNGNTSSLVLPDLNFAVGSAPITIETSDVSALGTGRVSPSESSDLVQFLTGGYNDPVIKTISPGGTNVAAHDFTFRGIEVSPVSATAAVDDFVDLGLDSTLQNTTASVPENFVFNQCYITGLDYIPADNNNYQNGIALNTVNTTIENCYVSDIHYEGVEAHGIVGDGNSLGNFVITNNFVEATGENIFFGGSESYLGQSITNVVISHNYLYKPLSWDKFSSQWDGNSYDVKNLLEFKDGVSVTVEDNLFQNCWVGADQIGEAINIDPKNEASDGSNSWALVHDITIENNAVENCGVGVDIGIDAPSTNTGHIWYTLPAYNITVDNNLFEDINGEGNGSGLGFEVTASLQPGYNITFNHNTLFGFNDFLSLGGGANQITMAGGFVFTNNIGLYGLYGVFSSNGGGTDALNANASGISITNGGSGYTAAPTVTFSGGGGSGATGKALISTNGAVVYVQITSDGSDYTAAPTVSFSGGGGSGAAATATQTDGIVAGWTFGGNVIIGMPGSDVSSYPNVSGMGTNYYSDTDPDTTGFLDTAGDEYGLLSTSAYYDKGTDGTSPGVNETSLLSAMGSGADFVPVDATLQNYWKFDAGSGTTDTDNGTAPKTASLSSSSLWTTSGEMNDAIALTGSSSGSVSVPSFAADSSFTFAAWVKPASLSATEYIASTANNAFSLYLSSGDLIAKGTTGMITGPALTAGKWVLVSATYTSGTLTLYVDGASVGSTSSATTTSGSTTLYIGGDNGSVSSFNGTIDDVRYYSSALSASQLSWLYAGFGPIIGGISPTGTSTITSSTTGMGVFALGHADDIESTYKIPGPISFSWTEVSGPAGVTFSANNSNAAQDTTVTWPGSGSYVIELTVTDGLGGSTSCVHPLTVSIGATVPNVPTGVTAVASGTDTTVAVNWSESSTGSIDYNIQRSTNGTSGWTTVATALTNTSYTDSSAAAGTTYYYEVDAYYPPSGTPSAWSSSANAATMAAYEGFAYATGNGQKWQGANGGLGWSTAWSLSGTNDTSIVAGLSYTNGSSALTTSGNAAQIIADSNATRSLASTVGTAGSTLWVSAEMNLHGSGTLGAEIDLGVYSGSTANDVRLGAPNSNGDIGAAVDIYPYANSVSTSTSIVANTTYFVVYEIQYLTTGDVISIYEDPTLVTQPTSASAVLTLPSTQQLKSTTELSLNSNEVDTDSQWDELRLGPTYASVTPDPLITSSGKKSSHSHRTSPFLSSAAATGKSSEILSASKPASSKANHFYLGEPGSAWQWADAANDLDNVLLGTTSKDGLFN